MNSDGLTFKASLRQSLARRARGHAIGVAILLSMNCNSVVAHPVLDQAVGTAGSYFKAVLRVGHGCNGSPTRQIVIQIPKGFQGAKPQPKHGWKLLIRKAQLDEPYTSHGKVIRDDVVELSWEALAPEYHLQDGHFDEFSFTSRLPTQAGTQWIKVIQRCETDETHWIEVPERGGSTKGLRTPAAKLELRPQSPSVHAH